MCDSFLSAQEAFSFYPTAQQVDAWCGRLLAKADSLSVCAAFCDDMPVRVSFGNGPNALASRYIRFDCDGRRSFYGYWQPALKSPAPLMVNLPGYGGSINLHPQLNDDGYHVLHISPLGYITPSRPLTELAMEDGNWPVLHNTAMGMAGGYEDWLCDCLLAVRWAIQEPEVLQDRVSLYGTSQGGGGSILLGSLLGDGVRCICADLPFLTAFPLTRLEGNAYGILQKAHAAVPRKTFWNRLGYVDTLSHAHRIHVPILLSSGGRDDVCPKATIDLLFERLHTTKQYTCLEQGIHTHSRESMYLFRSWMALFA